MAFNSGWPVAHVADDPAIAKETLRNAVRRAEADQDLRAELVTSEELLEIKKVRR